MKEIKKRKVFYHCRKVGTMAGIVRRGKTQNINTDR